MVRKRLIWKVTPAYLLGIGLCTAAVAWYSGQAVRDSYYQRTARELEEKASLLVYTLRPILAQQGTASLQRLCQEMGLASGTRVTVIDAEGWVLGDSQEDSSIMDNHLLRPEVQRSLAVGIGQSIRYSNTLKKQMMYVAVPLALDGDQPALTVRTAVALTDISSTLWGVYRRIILGGLVLAVLAVGLTMLIFTHQISLPLKRLQRGAERFASGRFDQEVDPPDSQEIGALAQSFNTMAHQLEEKIQTMTQQSDQHEAILASMVEGVIAVDAQERIISLNQTASHLLNVIPDQAKGRKVYEAVRNTKLQTLISRTLSSDKTVVGHVTLRVGETSRLLQAHGAALYSGVRRVGAVMVLHDITQLRQLEAVRQQFVANVSHELKTPITAIKAAVETLKDEQGQPSSAPKRFLEMIARQADRLHAIVEDLLMLARVEQGNQLEQKPLQPGPILPVLQAAAETCHAKAKEKNIGLDLQAQPNLQAKINTPLLEQAVVNLLENAVKYSPENSRVWVEAARHNGEVVLTVQDEGPGIAAPHLPRIFERFYRVDNHAATPDQDGTGLGLAIVKHIALAHNGWVGVESVPDRGCTFHIHLPTHLPNPEASDET